VSPLPTVMPPSPLPRRLVPALPMVAATLMCCLGLGGCSGLKSALGLEPQMPDEFAVVSRAPLSMPPDFSLRPPRPGAHRPQDQTPTEEARKTVFRASTEAKPAVVEPSDRSPGEAAFLKEAGASNADAGIRQIVAREASKNNAAERGFVDRLLFWEKPSDTAEVLDPIQEARRLQQNTATASSTASTAPQTQTAEATPTITRKSSSQDTDVVDDAVKEGPGGLIRDLLKGIF
jgi:hypothetical protein